MEARRMIECVSRARLVLNVGCRPHVGDSKASSFGVQLMMILMFFQWFPLFFNGFLLVVLAFPIVFVWFAMVFL